jgi:hypothetical protein
VVGDYEKPCLTVSRKGSSATLTVPSKNAWADYTNRFAALRTLAPRPAGPAFASKRIVDQKPTCAEASLIRDYMGRTSPGWIATNLSGGLIVGSQVGLDVNFQYGGQLRQCR